MPFVLRFRAARLFAAAFLALLRLRLPGCRAPAGITQGATVEGHHRIPLANGLQVLLVSGRDQADDDGQRHVPGRLAPRELRRDRHGAPARAPAVQGHADDRGTSGRSSAGAACASTARPGTTAPTTSRRSPRRDDNLDWALAMEADRMVNSFIARKDLDTEMTVVRNEMRERREQPRQRAVAADAGDRVRLAQLRQAHDRRALRRRERRHRAAAGVLPPVLPARQRGADRRRQVRRDADARAGSRSTFGAIPKPDAHAAARSTRAEPVQDGERIVTLRRVGDTQLVGVAATTRVPGAHPDAVADRTRSARS